MSSLESRIKTLLEELKKEGWRGTISEQKSYNLNGIHKTYVFEALLYKINEDVEFIKIRASRINDEYKISIEFPKKYIQIIKKYFEGKIKCEDDKCYLIENA